MPECTETKEPRGPLAQFLGRAERGALDRCLRGISSIRTMHQAGPAPGRLRKYWKGRDCRVVEGEPGAAGGEDGTEAASEDKPDLIVTERPVDVSDRAGRVEHLRRCGGAARRYVLAYYRTRETLKGEISRVRESEARERDVPGGPGTYCSHAEVLDEVRAGGLRPLALEAVSEFSDRAIVLAERPEADENVAPGRVRPKPRVRRPKPIFLTAGLFLALGLLYGLNLDRSFWGENEAYYALGARSVLEGNWLLPQINPDLPADKPPLTFWWVATVAWAFGGIQEWTARLANLIAALGVLAAMFGMTGGRIGRWGALLSVAVLGTSYEFWENAREVNTDIPMLFMLTLAWWGLFDLLEGPYRRGRWFLMWGMIGLAVLTKGPVAWILTGLIAGTYALARFGWRGGWAALLRLQPMRGIGLSLAPFALWLAAVYTAKGIEPLETILYKHNVERFVDAFDHQEAWYYYILELPVNLLPWSLLLPLVVVHYARRWRMGSAPGRRAGSRIEPHQLFALCAMGAVFVFFSASSSKRDYYLLPVMPWAALLIGEFLWLSLSRLTPMATLADCSERQFGGLLLGLRRGRRLVAAFATVVFGMSVYAAVVSDVLDVRKTARPFAESVGQVVDEDDELVIVDGEDPRLMYYLKDRFLLWEDSPEALDRLRGMLRGGQEIDLLVSAGDLRPILELEGVKLYLQKALTYRGDDFFLITNEPSEGARPLVGLPVKELSGMCFHPGRGTLFVVGDQGDLAEVGLDGRLVKKRRIGGDLEGITLDPEGDRLYAIDESANIIHRIDPDTLEIRLSYAIVAGPEARTLPDDGEDGIEGLYFRPGGRPDEGGGQLFCINQNDPPLLMEMVLEEDATPPVARIAKTHRLAGNDFAELGAGTQPGRLLAIMDDADQLIEMSLAGRPLRRCTIPGGELEAMTLLRGGQIAIGGESGYVQILELDELFD
jgi:4-amino-4-deoxy-L-arabinose transferase-like glycosyltransferase